MDNPLYFAKIHQHIYELEKQKVTLFNNKGPLNWEFITIMSELNMAYMEAKDTINEVLTAQQIYQGTVALNGKDDSLSYEAFLALGSSFVDDERLGEAQAVVTELLEKNVPLSDTNVDEEREFNYLTYIDTLCLQADIFNKKEDFFKEEPIRITVKEAYEEIFGTTNSQTIMARAALASCFEKQKRYREALDQYIIIRSYLDIEKDLATDAERIGLIAHIAKCFRKTGNLDDAKVAYQWALNEAVTFFGEESSIVAKMKKLSDSQ
ncbi:tetratricopeptide repeat protein [uncultured Sphaerochaeta sp.]|uniref:tetratricopeptide repeat protein n=1 Tax=uncultured Sphaerochaeta sp. TaxID=886478 RepID=UPI00374A5BB7